MGKAVVSVSIAGPGQPASLSALLLSVVRVLLPAQGRATYVCGELANLSVAQQQLRDSPGCSCSDVVRQTLQAPHPRNLGLHFLPRGTSSRAIRGARESSRPYL